MGWFPKELDLEAYICPAWSAFAKDTLIVDLYQFCKRDLYSPLTRVSRIFYVYQTIKANPSILRQVRHG
jgi:hypothetical protein